MKDFAQSTLMNRSKRKSHASAAHGMLGEFVSEGRWPSEASTLGQKAKPPSLTGSSGRRF
jgi:hypothetical protein